MSRYKLSQNSLDQLHTCDAHLQELVLVAHKLTPMDFKVLQGYRSIEEQKRLFAEGRTTINGVSKLSNHNHTPARAVDIVPYPVDWKDLERFRFLGGFILGVAGMLGLRIRWGGDWDGDGSFRDQTLNDLPHFELLENASIS